MVPLASNASAQMGIANNGWRRQSGGAKPRSDVVVEWFDDRMPGNLEPATQIIPDRDAQFVTGFRETEESIAAIPTDITPRPGTDLPPRDVGPDVVSEPLVCSGISGRSSTISNSALLVYNRASKLAMISTSIPADSRVWSPIIICLGLCTAPI